MHGYEIEFVFGRPMVPSLGYTEAEVEMSARFLKHWVNFARTGYALNTEVQSLQLCETWKIIDCLDFHFFLSGIQVWMEMYGPCSLLTTMSMSLWTQTLHKRRRS